MPNSRSGSFWIYPQVLILELKRLDSCAVVGHHQAKPVTAEELLSATEYTALVSLLVEEQKGEWFSVRLPDFEVKVDRKSPLFQGLTHAIKSYHGELEPLPGVLKQPIEHCYWVVPGKLLAGEFPGALHKDAAIKKIKALTDFGVEAFIDLTEERDGLESYAGLVKPSSYQRFGIQDVSTPASAQVTLAILNAIDGHMAAGRMVYVHCWGGVGRTGVIVGCWLVRHGLEPEAAVERLAELWKQCPKSTKRKSPETQKQVDYIRSWKEEPNPHGKVGP